MKSRHCILRITGLWQCKTVVGQEAVAGPLFLRLLGVLQAFLFDGHIGEFVRVEDLAAFQTFYKFSIFFSR